MKVLIKFFSYYRIIAGRESITLTLAEEASVEDMIAELAKQIKDLSSKLEQTAVLVNQRQASMETPLKEGDEVSMLYLIGGG